MTDRPVPIESDSEDVLFSSVCASEMTGLIPSGRPNKDERDSYQDVLPYFPSFGKPHPAI